jgi:hypothetical protein
MRSAALLLALGFSVFPACGSKATRSPVEGSTGGSSSAGSGGSTPATGGSKGTGTGGTKGTAGTAGTLSPSATGGVGGTTASGQSPMVGACRVFPSDSPWNQDVSATPLRADSGTYIGKMAPTRGLHADWGTVTQQYGIPFATGAGASPQPIKWTTSWGPTESDKVACASGGQFCYPIPSTAPIEGGTGASADSDRHVLYVDTIGAPGNCTLYELYQAQNPTAAGWSAANGAVFHLESNALRTAGWTSADAAGLPILPGLVRLDEVKAGAIRHALRFTMNSSYQGYIHPATHAAGSSDVTLPPMGLRVRLKASFDPSGATGPALVILTAMKKFGLILADNGSDWYISGESNEGWAPLMDAISTALGRVHGSDFEVVDTGPISTAGL